MWTFVNRNWLILGAVVVAVVLFFSYLSHVRADEAMQQTLKQQKEIFDKQADLISQQQKAIADISDRMEHREAETSRTIATLTAMQANIARQTPQQNLQQLPQVAPINPTATATGEAILSKQDVAKLLEFSLECKKCQVELEARKADVSDLNAKVEAKDQQLTAKDEQIAAVEKQRDAAVKAAKGGSLWKRIGVRIKWVAVGVATGAVAVLIMR